MEQRELIAKSIQDKSYEIADLFIKHNQEYITNSSMETMSKITETVNNLENKSIYEYNRNLSECMQDRINLQADVKLAISDFNAIVINKLLSDISSLYPERIIK